MTYKILLPVDGSEGSLRAARHLAKMAGMVPNLTVEVHLANIQPVGDDWMTRRSFKAEELAAMEAEWADAALAPAREILLAAGVTPILHTRQGDIAPTIARLADELGCDQITMGTRGLSPLSDLLMGSVATKVLHLAQVPVTFVK
jgi:nucleotide-binding universal stress UspA family protein